MRNTAPNKQDNIESMPQYKNWFQNAKIRLKTSQQIADAIHTQKAKDEKNAYLFNTWIENLIDRAYPLDWDTEDKKEISEIDCYYIPDTKDPIIQELLQNDDKIYEILNGILCRPQFFWQNRRTGERTITKEWLDRLNYILNMAAKHTLRHIEESSLIHSNSTLNDNNNPGYWEPTSTRIQDGEARIWYNYFKHKLKDFTVSQRSDKDKKHKIYFNIQTKEEFCQLIRALIVDYIPIISGWSQIYPSVYEWQSEINKKWVTRLKPMSTRIKDWLFLKNISCFADMERSDTYTWKRTHFPQIVREIFEPLLQIHKMNDTNKDNSKKAKWQKTSERSSITTK